MQSLQQYHRDGFVVLRAFLSPQEMDELQSHVDRYIHDVIPRMPAEQVFYEDRRRPESLKQIQQMGMHDDFFRRLMTEGKFLQLAETLLEGPVFDKNLQYFNKAPGINAPTPPHQDGYYFMLSPPLALTMWLALDEVDEENGCVRYLPKSHSSLSPEGSSIRPHSRTETLGFSQGITDYPRQDEREREVAIHARPGDLLVHDALTIHRADGNRSSHRTRRALGMIYYSQLATEDKDQHDDYQRRLADELKSEGRI